MAPPSQSSSFDNLPLPGKVFILVALLGLISAIYYFVFHLSLAEDIESAQVQYTQLQNELNVAERRQQEYLAAVQELASREGIDRRNKRVLPEDAEIAGFLDTLNRTAELSGLSILLVQPRPQEAQDMYTRIPVALRLSGRYHQLAKFFYNMSQVERAISMEDISLREPNVSETDEVLLDVDVLATTFRRPVAPAQGGPPGGAQ